MLPIEWLGIPVYAGLVLFIGLFGMGDLREKDLKYFERIRNFMFIPGVWMLVTSWTAVYTLIGVASYIFWRDSSASNLYDAALILHWVVILCMCIWMRLAKMPGYTTAAFIFLLLGVVCPSIVVLALFGVAENWISFGVYFLAPVVFFISLVWSGRLAFSDDPKAVAAREYRLPSNQEDTARENARAASSDINASMSNSVQLNNTSAKSRFTPGFGGNSNASLLFGNAPQIAGSK